MKTTLIIITVLVLIAACETRAKTVLAIQAANESVDWSLVESFSQGKHSWSIKELVLIDFGKIMNLQGFQSALDASESTLQKALAATKPDALLVSSKGVGVLTLLVTKGLWTGPAVLLSPIPNECDHIHGKTWELQWQSTVQSLADGKIGPIVIGVGTSLDEKTFITDEMEQTGICGKVKPSMNLFEYCPSWFLYSFPGDHSWKNNPANAKSIALLIDIVFHLDGNQILVDSEEL